MIERVWRQARQGKLIDKLIVATDDKRIASVALGFGASVAMTGPNHQTGTDRLAEVSASEPGYAIVVNIQGDEPLISPQAIDQGVEPLLHDPEIEMATLAMPLRTLKEAESQNMVKTVIDRQGFALYFSRAPIPFYREQHPSGDSKYLGHIGLYVYRRTTLLKLSLLAPAPLELAEQLEQLRALENGIRIKVVPTSYHSLPVDTPADVESVERALGSTGSEAGNFPL